DTLSPEQTRTMTSAERIVITNNSSLPVDFGFQVGDGDGLVPGYIAGPGQFVLRAVFGDMDTPPEFSPGRDFVKSAVVWSTGDIFGAGGYGISVGDTEKLWLQFIAPADAPSGSYTITLILWVRARLP
ncbi:hypothetical protein J7K99_06150, partial [bacterium]|nr:hypothetical protein [bacterium]